MASDVHEYLEHFGVVGMRWHFRKRRKQDQNFDAGYRAGRATLKKDTRFKRKMKRRIKAAALITVAYVIEQNAKNGRKIL